MRSESRRQICVVLAALVVFFTWLGKPYLWDEDEPKNAECAREMLEAGNWSVPQFNYALRTDKPILLYWLMLSSYKTFGVGEFAARFWSAALAVGTCWLTYQLGRRLYRPTVGLWSGLAMASCLMFAVSGRAATPDSTLIFCTTLTLFAFVRFGGVTQGVLARGGYLALYAAMSLAVLAKGPVGVVLPGGIMGLFLLLRHRPETLVATLAPRRLWSIVRALRPLTAVVVLAVVALPWYVYVGMKTEGAWLAGFLGTHNVGRFTSTMEGHGGSIFYYPVAVLVGFFPWSCFLPLAIFRLVRRLRTPDGAASREADLFTGCWIGAYLTFFTLAGTKLPSYVLPCYPALAVVTGVLIDEWLRSPSLVSRGWFRAALATPAVTGLALAVALPIVASRLLPGDQWLGALGVSLIVGTAAMLWSLRSRPAWVPALFALTAVTFVTSLVAGGASRVSRHATSPAIAADARAVFGDEARLVGFGHFEPTMVFYSQHHVPVVYEAVDVPAALARTPSAVLITRDDLLDELAQTFGEPPQIVARYRRAWRTKGEVVVVRPPESVLTAQRNANSDPSRARK